MQSYSDRCVSMNRLCDVVGLPSGQSSCDTWRSGGVSIDDGGYPIFWASSRQATSPLFSHYAAGFGFTHRHRCLENLSSVDACLSELEQIIVVAETHFSLLLAG